MAEYEKRFAKLCGNTDVILLGMVRAITTYGIAR